MAAAQAREFGALDPVFIQEREAPFWKRVAKKSRA
jgi:hypothetical protein